MNRRGFVKSLGAAMAVPALPAQSLMAATSTSAPAALAPHGLYMWGKMLAEVHGHCSTGMLTSMLKIEPKVALGIYDALLTNGVVAPANTLGISHATNPLHVNFPQARARTLSTTRAKKPDLQKLNAKLDDMLENDADESDQQAATDSSNVNQEALISPHEPDEPLSRERGPDDRSGTA